MDLNPCLSAIRMRDPRNRGRMVDVVAFYSSGEKNTVDAICRADFLGNFFDLGCDALTLQPPNGAAESFSNAEAAFQALKFWSRAHEFRDLTGEEAFHKMKRLQRNQVEVDMTYAGFGSNWKAMKAVLKAKFRPGSPLMEALARTGDAYLLEHNPMKGRDKLWSDDKFGSGKNWLGTQLMLVRDEHSASPTWENFLCGHIENSTGNLWNTVTESDWRDIVKPASDAALSKVMELEWDSRARSVAAGGEPKSSGNALCWEPHGGALPGVIRWEDMQDTPFTPLADSDRRPRFQRSVDLNKRIALIRNNITDVPVDAIIVPPPGTRSRLVSAICKAAGPELEKAFKHRNPVQQGLAVITKGFNIKARFVLHADNTKGEVSYWAALDLAKSNGLRSVALPCLRDVRAMHIALKAVRQWLEHNREEIDVLAWVTPDESCFQVCGTLLSSYFPRHGDLECKEDGDVMVITFAWRGEASSVTLHAQFFDWAKQEVLVSRDGCFFKAVSLPKGQRFQFGFFVDKQWRIRQDLPMAKDGRGSMNNVIDLTT